MNAPNATKIILLRLQSIVIGRKNSLNDRRVKNLCNVRVACKICFRSAGVCKFADPCLFFAKSVDPPNFCSNPKPQPHPQKEKGQGSKVNSYM